MLMVQKKASDLYAALSRTPTKAELKAEAKAAGKGESAKKSAFQAAGASE